MRIRAHRSPAILPLLCIAAVAPATADPVDLVTHNGFEACWSKSITKQTFLDILQGAIDDVTSCIPQSTGAGYSACNQPNCPNNSIGCPVTTHAGPFAGAFAAGSGNGFTSTGSADDIVIDIDSIGGPCTITASNILLDYALDYSLQIDGNNGLYAASLDQSILAVHDGYVLTGSNVDCQTIAVVAEFSLKSQIETQGAAGVAALEGPATVGESVCPLNP